MARSLTLDLTFDCDNSSTINASDELPIRAQPRVVRSLSFSEGTGAGLTYNRLYYAQRTVNSGANDDLDLAGGLTDVFGDTLTFALVKAIIVCNESIDGTQNATSATLTVGGGTNPFQSWIAGSTRTITPIYPGSGFAIVNPDGWAVTAGTGDILRLSAIGANCTYWIMIIGTSA